MGGEETRRAEGVRIAVHLARAIAQLIGPGPVAATVWERVKHADRAFDKALVRWMRSGTDADKEALRAAYRGVLQAWHGAVAPHAARRTA